MSAIADEHPEELRQVVDGLIAFADKEILPRHAANRGLPEDGRGVHTEDRPPAPPGVTQC